MGYARKPTTHSLLLQHGAASTWGNKHASEGVRALARRPAESSLFVVFPYLPLSQKPLKLKSHRLAL